MTRFHGMQQRACAEAATGSGRIKRVLRFRSQNALHVVNQLRKRLDLVDARNPARCIAVPL